MTSNFLSVKLGEKITIPENIVCLITFKDKTYYELTHGTYSLTRELLIDLYKKQFKTEDKAKNISIDFFFINTTPKNKEIVFSNKLLINNVLTKSFVRLYLTLNVADYKVFSKYIRAEFAYVTAKDTDKYIFDDIEQITTQFFLRKNFKNHVISNEVSEELKSKLGKKLASVGLNLSYFKVEIDSTKTKEKRSEFNFFDYDTVETNTKEESLSNSIPVESTPVEVVKQTEETAVEEIEKPAQNPILNTQSNINPNICPVCKSKRIQNSLYCIRCGNKFQ